MLRLRTCALLLTCAPRRVADAGARRCSMRARGAAAAACVAAVLLTHRARAVSIDAADSSSFRVAFNSTADELAVLRFELSTAARVADMPFLCGVALAQPGIAEDATLNLTDLPESAALAFSYTLSDGSESRGGAAWVVLPSADAGEIADTCWTCVFASLSLYAVAWTQALRRGTPFVPVSVFQQPDESCACWVCGAADGVCRPAQHDACDLQSPSPAVVDDSMASSPAASPLSMPPQPPQVPSAPPPPWSPPPPWWLEFWPQLAVPQAGRPPPPAVSGMAGPQTFQQPPAAPPPALPSPWWLSSRGSSDSSPPPQLQSNITAGVPWWALLGEDAASPPPPALQGADVVAQTLGSGSPPAPAGDTSALQQALEGWLSAVPSLAAPVGGGTSPAAIVASVLADVVARKEAKRPSAAAATAIGLGAAAASSLWGLWTSPVLGPYVLELWAQAESTVWPGAKGAG